MASDINIKKPETRVPKTPSGRVKIRDRRIGPRRSLLTSRLTRNIFFSNLIGLVILVGGSLAMGRFQNGLIDAKVENLRSLASTITTVMAEDATGFGSAAQLDVQNARQVVSELAPIVTEAPQEPVQKVLRERVDIWLRDKAHNLPWRKRRRAALRRDLKADLRTALGGEAMMGQRYDDEDKLIVTVSLPVKRVQQILGVVTVESSDVDSIVNAERKALAPIIGLAFLATLLSSLALTLFITMPMRKLARAAELVTRSSRKRGAIPDLSKRRDEIGDLSSVMRDMTEGLYARIDDIANFAADVAHEIKNPLTSLRSASDTLRVAKTNEQREKLISIIQQDVSRMDRLITDISKASKVSTMH